MRADLVQDALQLAITLRGQLPGQVVFHSDRGTQYASAQITAFAAANGITLAASEVFGEDVADRAVAGTTGLPPRR
jgi:transposase InsO family protein